MLTMENPYADVDWEHVERLHSVNHTHTHPATPGEPEWDRETSTIADEGPDPQTVFDSIYESGIRHFALSNYYPSKPTDLLSDYFDAPDDALGCPNAEHGLTCERGHFTAIGSRANTGDGFDGPWRALFEQLLESLAYDDGGGIVVNHPKRTGLSVEALLAKVDFDERVLGVEAYNHRCEAKYVGTGDAVSVWDELLLTGRTVYGFFNPDYHLPWTPPPEWAEETLGRNVLLVPERTEGAAARAYRRGHFYGALRGSGLTFESIRADEDRIAVETNRAARVDFVSDRCRVQEVHAADATYEVRGDETYVRVEAREDDGERIFSQPVVYDFDTPEGTERFTSLP
jgi:hypothetical protein